MAWDSKKKTEAVQQRPIETLTFEALLDLKGRVDAEVSARSASELEALKSRLLLVASTTGIEIGDLFGIKAPSKEKKQRKKREVPIRYRDPETGETWTGLGKPKKWLAEKEAAGHSREEFAVN